MTTDVVVIGLGAAGSGALHYLAKRGVATVGLDRYSPPHTEGSTHGGSRIIRKAYFEGAQYLPLLNRAYELWADLERVTEQRLITRCGCLNIAPHGSAMIAGARRSAIAAGSEAELLSPAAVRERFPAFHLGDDEVALFEPDAGSIHPELSVAAHLAQARLHGARVLLNEPVRSWTVKPAGVAVRTAKRTVHADVAVVTAGAWIRSLLQEKSPPVKVERVVNVWFRTTEQRFAPARFPTFIWEHAHRHSYGMPDLGHGLKAGLHHLGALADHPEAVDRTIGEEEVRALHRLLSRLFPRGLGPAVKAATCLYTNMPDKHYLIDYLDGTESRVVVGSACSGHGFKASAAVGEALADLALQQTPRTRIDGFQWR